jgi:hypothetical protein
VRQENRVQVGLAYQFHYDAMGNLIESLDPRDTTAEVLYDANNPPL